MYNTNNAFYAAGEYLLGIFVAAITIFSIAAGFLFGLSDAARYFRMKSV